MTTHRGKVKGEPDAHEFMHGFAVAVGTLARVGYPSHAIDIMDCNGITLRDLVNAKVEAFDLKPIRAEWKLKGRKR